VSSDQSNAAAERSAHVTRGAARSIPGESFLVEVKPGVFQIKALAEANQIVAELQDALRAAILVLEVNGMSAGDFREVLKRSRRAQTQA